MPILQVPAGEKVGPEGLPNLLKLGEKEDEGEKMKEVDDKEEEMEGKRRDEEDIQESLVVEEGMIVNFPMVPLLLWQLLLQDSFQKEEIKQSHCRDTQRSNIMNYLVTIEAPDHMPLASLPCLPEQCNDCGKKKLFKKVQPF